MEIGLLLLMIMAVSSFLGKIKEMERRRKQRESENYQNPMNYPQDYSQNPPQNYPQSRNPQNPMEQRGQMPGPIPQNRMPGQMPQQGIPGQMPRSQMPPTGGGLQRGKTTAGSWEDMERHYGIRIERKDAPSTIQMPRTINQGQTAPGPYSADTMQRGPRPMQIPQTQQAPTGQVPSGSTRQFPNRPVPSSQGPTYGDSGNRVPTNQVPRQQGPMERPSYEPRSIERSGPYIKPTFDPAYKQRRTHSKYSHIPGDHRGAKLPPGGLRAGIKWAMILERPKALQRRAQ